MLTTTLRGLERDGFVTRTVTPTIPPRVDYELTELGCDEAGFARALGISDVAICERNILGDAPKVRMSDWEEQIKGGEFALRRHDLGASFREYLKSLQL